MRELIFFIGIFFSLFMVDASAQLGPPHVLPGEQSIFLYSVDSKELGRRVDLFLVGEDIVHSSYEGCTLYEGVKKVYVKGFFSTKVAEGSVSVCNGKLPKEFSVDGFLRRLNKRVLGIF